MSKKTPFWERHFREWILAGCLIIISTIANSIWKIYYGPIGANTAVRQVEDTATAFATHQAVNYGNIVPTIIIWGAVIGVILFLIPTIKDIVKGKF